MTSYKNLLFTLCLWLSPLISYADTIIEAGIHFGGDELLTTPYTDGRQGTMNAGEMLSFAFGPLFNMSESWKFQTTIGVKTDAEYATDVEVSWVRFPFNATFFYETEKTRFGIGMTYHLGPKVKGSGAASNIQQEYEDALGYIVEFNYRRHAGFLWGIRFTFIDYERKDLRLEPIDGNSIGLLIIAHM
ncbi:MAG: hypothetical protein OEZ33_04895 [Gammaproteobacteria bacterium]|nr:hypothetical protein [Gammaproteobacteria bacterium]MDH5777526.1 hypothetical protein [Gammaproteobacteria bacterium]